MNSTQDIQTLVHELHEAIARGEILEAIETFYDDDVVMQENTNEPWRGKAKNIEREKEWLANIAEWKGFEVKSIAVAGETTFAETTFDFVTKDGQEVHMEQVARARWKNGKIVEERFYHGE